MFDPRLKSHTSRYSFYKKIHFETISPRNKVKTPSYMITECYDFYYKLKCLFLHVHRINFNGL